MLPGADIREDASPRPAPGPRRPGAAVLIGCVALYLLLARAMGPFTPDDSYISFRYAQHLAAGVGLTFNPGEAPVEGYSNFLWILICAALARAGLDLVAWSGYAGLVLGAATLGVAWRMLEGRRSALSHQALVLIALATAGPFVLYSISGLETALFGFLLLLMLLCAERAAAGRGRWLFALSAAGVALALCRPEGAIAYPLILAILLVSRMLRPPRAALLGSIAVFGVAMTVYHLWRIQYFGEWLPMPFHSKGAGGSLVAAWKTNVGYLFVRQNHYFAPLGWYYLAFAGVAALGQITRIRNERRIGIEALPFTAALAFAALYMNFVDWMPGMRYFAPLIAPILISLAPLEVRVDLPRRGAASGTRGAPGMAIALAVVLCAGLGSIAALKLDARRNEASTQGSQVALGRWLAENVDPGALLAVSDAGAIPFHSGLRTVDIHPRSLTDVRIATGGWSNDYVFERGPDVVVLVSFSTARPAFYGEHRSLYEDPRFGGRYRLVGVTRYDWYMDRSYWVFAGAGARLGEERFATLPAGIGAE